MSRGRFSGGLLGFIDGIKSGKDVVELCTEMSKSEAGIAGLNALAALLGIGTAASLAPAALPLTVGAVSVTAAVKFYLWWQNEQEKKTESAKLTDIQAILQTWQGSASGGWDRLEEKYGDLDASIKQNVVGFIESLLRYELGEVQESVDALTTQHEVRFQQMAEQLAEYQRQNHQVFASLSKSFDDSLGNSLVELIAGGEASQVVKAELAISLGPKFRTLLDMPSTFEAILETIESAVQPKLILEIVSPDLETREENRLLYTQRWTKLVGVNDTLQGLRNFCHGDGFKWLILTAPGGCGKSRIAQELCDELWLNNWSAGFYKDHENIIWGDFNPSKPTLIVVDYLWAKSDDWPERIKALHKYGGKYPVRLLILERPADVSAWNALIRSKVEVLGSYAGPKPTRLSIDAFKMPGLKEDKHIWRIMKQVWQGQSPVSYKAIFPKNGPGYRTLDPFGRPLIAILTALAIVKFGSSKLQWDLEQITRIILTDILEKWTKSSVDDDHVRLLFLATLVDGVDLRFQPEILGLPAPGVWDENQCKVVSAYTDEFNPRHPVIPAFRPDPLGEAFAIYCLEGEKLCIGSGNLHSRKNLSLGILKHSVINKWEKVQNFVRRCIADYPTSIDILLPALASVEHLNLSGLMLSDITSLKNLTNLKTLALNKNEIQHLDGLGNMKNLTHLTIRNNQVTSLDTLKRNTSITHLHVRGNFIKSLTPLSKLENIIFLSASRNLIDDLEGLESLKMLTRLILSNNRFSSLKPLIALKNLRELHLNSNFIESLDHLSELRNLEVLQAKTNFISSIDPLSNLTRLKSLTLNRNSIKSVEPLANLHELVNLQLIGNQISCIEPLADLPTLTTLYLSKNRLTSIKPLFRLHSLKELSLKGNPDLCPSEIEALRKHLPQCAISE